MIGFLLLFLTSTTFSHIADVVTMNGMMRRDLYHLKKEANCRGNDGHLFFHYIFSTGTFDVRQRRSLESVFRSHPEACVYVHFNSKNFQGAVALEHAAFYLVESSYCVQLLPYTIATVLNEIIESGLVERRYLMKFMALIKRRKLELSQHWFSHETDLMRYFVLDKYGGWYFDTDVILMRRLDGLQNVIGLEDDHNINGAVIHTTCSSSFASVALKAFFKVYDPKKNWNHVGPKLLTDVVEAIKNDPHQSISLNIANQSAFEPIHYSMMEQALLGPQLNFDKDSVAFHYNNKISKNVMDKPSKEGSLQFQLLNHWCVLCSEII
jgi:lactosylceramide 4-alpha-galactosyltransferase